MSMLDGILGQLAGNATVAGLAARVGLTPAEIEMALAALAAAHAAPTDTVPTAAAQSGLPENKLQEILSHLGGEGALGGLAGMLAQNGAGGAGAGGGLGGMLGGLFGKS
jgi:hypothetical protein